LDTREQSFQGQLNAKVPYSVFDNDGYVKSGAFGDYLDRTFRNRVYNYSSVSGLSAIDEYDFSQFGTLDDLPLPNLHDSSIEYDGSQELTAYYLMTRAPLPEWVDLIGGFRVEGTVMETDIWTPGQDTIWLYRVGHNMADPLTYGKVYYQSNVDPAEGTTTIDETDILPALALNLKPVTDFNLRLTYAETIARPTFKEITPVLYQEFDSSKYFLGNPDLEISSLQNYDARVEWHPPKSADVVAVSYFYKTIKDPIQYTTYKLFTG